VVQLDKKNRVILVTGSRGWLGRVSVNLLQAQMPDYEIFSLSNGGKFDFWTFDFEKINVVGVVHLAFLTRDKILEIGKEKYAEMNNLIIRRAREIIYLSCPKWVVTVSSGAVHEDLPNSNYGELKLHEEETLLQVCQEKNSSLVIGRLWGATGSQMPINRNYAISDFICQAIESNQICVNSGAEVWRRYVDAEQFMEVLIRQSQTGHSQVLDSGGTLVEIGELATLISTEFSNVPVTRRERTLSDSDNNYFSKNENFERIAAGYGIKLLSMCEQVQETIRGHRAQLGL